MNTTATLQTAATPSKTDTRQLAETIQTIDGLACEGFSAIASIAKLALIALETPAGQRSMGDVAFVLDVIVGKAEEIKRGINFEAEEVGCSYVNDAEIRRMRAEHHARLAS